MPPRCLLPATFNDATGPPLHLGHPLVKPLLLALSLHPIGQSVSLSFIRVRFPGTTLFALANSSSLLNGGLSPKTFNRHKALLIWFRFGAFAFC